MGFFTEEINRADASSKLPWFPAKFAGDLQVDVCKGLDSKGKRAFIVEFTVLTTNMPQAVLAGGRYSWYQGIKPQQETTAHGAIIQFLLAALGKSPIKDKAEIEEKIKPNQMKLLNAAVSDANPLASRRVHLETSEKPLKEDKTKSFTLHNFSIAAPAVAA